MSSENSWRARTSDALLQIKQFIATIGHLGLSPRPERLCDNPRIAVCAIVRNEVSYLLEWIAYHRVIGFDYFYIYDNESTDGTTDILRKLERAGILKYTSWPSKPGTNPQKSAYENLLDSLDPAIAWIAFIDLDEFIVPKTKLGLKPFLDRCSRNSVAAVAINWKIFGSSGHLEKTDGLVMERFKKCSFENFHANRHYKTIARANLLTGFVTCHRAIIKNGTYIYPDGRAVGPSCTGKGKHIDHKTFQINHYFTKSQAEWQIKRKRGNAPFPRGHPKHLRPNDNFEDLNRNDAEDSAITQFMEKTKIEIESLKKLFDQPGIKLM